MKESSTMPISKPKFSDSIIALYGAARVPVGDKIPMSTIDRALGTMNLTITERMKMKFTLHNLGIIDR
jgi:hypothetical protein